MRKVLIALLATALLASCGASGSDGPAEDGATLSAESFASEIKKDDVVLIDVRTPEEFASGHIEGAKNIDVAGDFATQIAGLDKSATYALYCRSGNRSEVAMETMHQVGFKNVFHLGGGIKAWQAAGQPVV